MDKRRLLQLWANRELLLSIRHYARRHFPGTADRELAESEAWQAIEEMPSGTLKCELVAAARNAIRAKYMRQWRGRKKVSVNNPSSES